MPKKITILDIPSSGILGGVFGELICAISSCLQKQGIKVEYSRNSIDPKNINLIFGGYRLFINKNTPPTLPKNIIMFNLSPLPFSEEVWFKNYIDFLKTQHVIDYSFENIEVLKNLNNKNIRRHKFNFGFTNLSTFQFPSKNNSYLFFGKMNDLRLEKLKRIQNLGIKIKVISNTWGLERDIQIATSKAIFNIPKYEKNILEVYRIWHSLCLGTPVISEKSLDIKLNNEFSRFIQFVDSISPHYIQDQNLIAADIYKKETSFNESTKELIEFIKEID